MHLGLSAALGVQPTDFDPSHVSLAAWYKGDVGVVQAAGEVSQWLDQSGNGRHLVQNAAGKKPAFVPDAVNGIGALRGDGVNDFIGPVAFVMNLPFTRMFLVKCLTFDGATHDILADGGTSLASASQIDSFPEWNMYPDNVTYTSARVADNVYAVVTEIWDTVAGVGSLRVNGAQVKTGGAAAVTSGGFTLFGTAAGTRTFNAEVAEAILVASHPDAATLAKLEQYLMRRGGLI